MNFCAVALFFSAALAARVPTHPAQHKDAKTHQLVANSTKQAPQAGPGQSDMPKDCVEAMEKMKQQEFAEDAAKCEQKGQYPQKAIAALQNRDEQGAISHIKDLFVNCAKLPEHCADKVAPDLVIQLRFSGAAVSDDCAQKMQEFQQDEQKAKQVEECDKKEKLTESVLAALNKGNLKEAISSAETGLEKCMSMSKKCSYQIAPVLVNSVVMRAMMQQQGQPQEAPMTTVLVVQPVIVVEESATKTVVKSSALTKKHGTPSLLAMATKKSPAAPRPRALRKAAAPALLQESSHHRIWVSKLIMQLAKQQGL